MMRDDAVSRDSGSQEEECGNTDSKRKASQVSLNEKLLYAKVVNYLSDIIRRFAGEGYRS